MREGILGVICCFKYFRVAPFILEGVVGKTKYSRKSFAEETPQKHQGKEIQAKLLVTETNEQITHNHNNSAEKCKNLMIFLLLTLIGFKWTCECYLRLVGHIQLTKAPPQEQFETISSSRLM